MMPGRQTRGVECKSCLPRECAAKRFSSSKYSCSLCSQTYSFAQLLKVFAVKFLPGQQSFDIVCREACFLERQLCSSCQGRRCIRIMSNIPQCKNVVVGS